MQALKKVQYDEFVPCLYDTERDLIDRLHETCVRRKGDPTPYKFHYINNKKCNLYDLQTGDETTVPLDEVDISSIELGYMNYKLPGGKPAVVYLSRDVRKQYRQGLCSNNVLTFPREFSQNYHFFSQKGFIDMCRGEYPSYEEAIAELKKDIEGERAISIDVKIKREYSGVVMVYYRLKNVGWMAPESKKVNLMNVPLDWAVRRALQRHGIELEN
jgi:hypothetical protein